MDEADLCIYCQRPENEHHAFEGVAMPPGCQCNPLTWAPDELGTICDGYEGTGEANCSRCEHDKECHRA